MRKRCNGRSFIDKLKGYKSKHECRSKGQKPETDTKREQKRAKQHNNRNRLLKHGCKVWVVYGVDVIAINYENAVKKVKHLLTKKGQK